MKKVKCSYCRREFESPAKGKHSRYCPSCMRLYHTTRMTREKKNRQILKEVRRLLP